MNTIRRSSLIPAIFAAWLAYLVIDFLTHAVFLSPWWRETEPFWLPQMQLLKMIPFAYLSFALYAAGLVWLMTRILGHQPTSARAVRFGAIFGLFFGLVQGLANYSVVAMPPSALLVWPISVALASIGAAFSGASVLNARSPWKRFLLIIFIATIIFIVGIIIQNLLFSPQIDRLAR